RTPRSIALVTAALAIVGLGLAACAPGTAVRRPVDADVLVLLGGTNDLGLASPAETAENLSLVAERADVDAVVLSAVGLVIAGQPISRWARERRQPISRWAHERRQPI